MTAIGRLMIRHFFAFCGAWVVVLVASAIWCAVVPVVGFMSATEWSVTADHVSARISGRKLRACQYVAGSVAGYVRGAGGVWRVAPIEYSLEFETQSAAVRWGIDRAGVEPAAVLLLVRYDCDGSIKETQVGPFTVPR
ncbi:hypothetical protein [Breoghania sp.]|uniref:hypothetical protein n=1 Tax=Breoghania sp. TaxID=2065378 RepID=UPI002AA77799|nr:hypothetical protein [Breoghania sp.]